MLRICFIRILAVMLIAHGTAHASSGSVVPHDSPLWVSYVQRSWITGEPVSLLVSVDGAYERNSTATVSIQLPEGAKLVAGDLVRLIHPSAAWRGPADREWELRFVPGAPSLGQVRLNVRHVSSDGYHIDEGDYVMSVGPPSAETANGRFEPVREETIRKGIRFRYSGFALIPIDGPEYVTTQHLSVRARALGGPPGVCRSCNVSGSEDSVRFLAVISREGRLLEARVLGRAPGSPLSAAAKAARAALDLWNFSPAQAPIGPVADWVILFVPINTDKK